MAPSTQIMLSGCLTFGVPMLLAARELAALRRSGGKWRPDPTPAPSPRPGTPPTSASKPLPACLIPVRQPEPQKTPQKTRVLEPA